MKFKILKGTETFEKLTALAEEIKRVEIAADDLVRSVGGKTHCRSNFYLAGGVAAVVFDKQPEGWKKVGDDGHYMPKVKNKELSERFKALPTLSLQLIQDITGYPSGEIGENKDGQLVRFGVPGIAWNDEYVLFNASSTAPWTPPNADFIEILESEYIRLSEERKVKAKAK